MPLPTILYSDCFEITRMTEGPVYSRTDVELIRVQRNATRQRAVGTYFDLAPYEDRVAYYAEISWEIVAMPSSGGTLKIGYQSTSPTDTDENLFNGIQNNTPIESHTPAVQSYVTVLDGELSALNTVLDAGGKFGFGWIYTSLGTREVTLGNNSGAGNQPILFLQVGLEPYIDAATAITTSSAVIGGGVADAGGAGFTERGLYVADHPNPDENDMVFVDGASVGETDTVVTGLLPGTTYYARKYASADYADSVNREFLSPEISFTTDAYGRSRSYGFRATSYRAITDRPNHARTASDGAE